MRTILISGVSTAIAAPIVPLRRATFRMRWSVMKISMNMAAGDQFRNMEPFGSRTRSSLAGRRIATAIGFGLRRGAGPGWTTLLGDSPHSTTAVGEPLGEGGGGGPVHRGRW